jgi:hypothetical protein
VYPIFHINLSLINLSNLPLSPILNHILSHGSYTKETSQIDVQHHQHLPLSNMYEDHQHTITIYMSQPCTKACTKPSTYTIPSINHVPQPIPQHLPNLYQIMHYTYTNSCIDHLAKPVPYHVPNLYQIMHQQKPVPYHVPTPYHASTMYLTMSQSHQGMPHTYTKNVSQTMFPISKMLLKPCASTIYHITHDMFESCHTPYTI